jgi:GAF domain-containing protein
LPPSLADGVAVMVITFSRSPDRADRSLVASQIRSLLCVPLIFRVELGVIYADTTRTGAISTSTICIS